MLISASANISRLWSLIKIRFAWITRKKKFSLFLMSLQLRSIAVASLFFSSDHKLSLISNNCLRTMKRICQAYFASISHSLSLYFPQSNFTFIGIFSSFLSNFRHVLSASFPGPKKNKMMADNGGWKQINNKFFFILMAWNFKSIRASSTSFSFISCFLFFL